MRRYSLVIITVLLGYLGFGQNPTINNELPKVIPPAPTAAGLMKYEEIPVSNYTGVPDVSIPLFSSPTRSKDITMDISLRYHPASIAVDQVSGDVGLGWSLFAGGTVSRTVMGIPDETYRLASTEPFPDKGKFGIYQSTQQYHKNLTYKLLEFAKNNPNATFTDDEKRQYLWETHEQGMYDTEHDIWSYNFMGHSGSFTIEKNFTTNLLEVKKLSLADNIKIVNLYDAGSYEPTSFEIYDDKGYKFVFTAKETTKTDVFTDVFYQMGISYVGSSDYFLTRPLEYISAFRLTQVIDNNNKVLINITYNADNEVIYEQTLNSSIEYNKDTHADVEATLNLIALFDPTNSQMQNKKMEPKSSANYSKTNTKVKKIKSIDVKGFGKYEFEYNPNRLDYSDSNFNSVNLISIIKKDTIGTGNTISTVKLDYFYNDINFYHRKKLFLNSVRIYNDDGSEALDHVFEYEFPEDPNFDINKLGIDYWGYHTNINRGEARYTKKGASADFSRIGILKKIIYPTKGAATFEYETNRFSYIGDTLVDNFDNNPLNWETLHKSLSFNTLNQHLSLFTIQDAQTVFIDYTLDSAVQGLSDYRFNIYKKNTSGTFVFVKSVEHGDCFNPQCTTSFSLEPGEYEVSFSSADLNIPENFQVNAVFEYKQKTMNQNHFLLGGGNRIKKITYLTDNNEENPNSFAKEINYDYTMAPETYTDRSSGSLAFGIPQYEYIKNRLCHIIITATGSELQSPGAPPLTPGDVIYSGVANIFYKNTSGNSLSYNFQTNGSDVGYKYVKVYETDNGSTLYKYSSPIDFPEDEAAYDTSYPFYPTENNDYKRGNLVSQTIFDKADNLLQSVENEYEYVEADDNDKIVGLQTYLMGENCPYNYRSNTYASFKAISLDSGSLYPCQDPILNYYTYLIKRNIGWAKLIRKTTKNYFYPSGSSTANIVQTDETYDYNPVNKKISESNITNSKGEVLKTKYYYHTGDAPGHQNRISEIEHIEQYNGTNILSTSKISYSNSFSGNAAYLPQSIQNSKGHYNTESRINYNAYDVYGNPTEMQQADGTFISYIWGYNKTQPIAKIENATNAQIAAATGINFNILSEANFSIIDNLRTTLANAMVTTYTYKPLVGVETITDPKGYKMTYEYDHSGRLARVRDASGNILSENEYNYRTQN